jgi:signal peptidase I
MTFRGFITEGFVIPTGSMAPTLLGEHKRLHGPQTGWDFAVGFDRRQRQVRLEGVADPMLGAAHPGSGTAKREARTRMGDRILVLKSLYRFADPDRFDVVVFKNPTNPNGEDGNYIKRLIGLPNEAIWLVDGDVFAGSASAPDDHDAYAVQRKPDHVQRAVWQPVYHSDFFPRHPENLDTRFTGPPWNGDHWETRQRASYRCDTAEPSFLEWDNHVRPLNDWAPYNALIPGVSRQGRVTVSDVRVASTVVPDDEGLETTLEIEAQSHRMEFIVGAGRAEVRMRPSVYENNVPDEGWVGSGPVPLPPLPAGESTTIDCWHVDQRLALFVDGDLVAEYEYDWTPKERLEAASGRTGDAADLAVRGPTRPAMLRWHFAGSPVTLHRVRVDRDLYYRVERLKEAALKNPTDERHAEIVNNRYGYATHPDNLAVLGPDHFFMAGDNSAASSDSRLWGNPHPLVAQQIDTHPFVVNRKLMLGKAWVVYFPAPHSLVEDGKAFIPDFGRLRFIR